MVLSPKIVYWAKFEGKLFSDAKYPGPLLQRSPLRDYDRGSAPQFFFLQKLHSKISIFRFQVNSCNRKKLFEGKRKHCKLIFEVSALAILIHKNPNKEQILAHARQQSSVTNNCESNCLSTHIKWIDLCNLRASHTHTCKCVYSHAVLFVCESSLLAARIFNQLVSQGASEAH